MKNKNLKIRSNKVLNKLEELFVKVIIENSVKKHCKMMKKFKFKWSWVKKIIKKEIEINVKPLIVIILVSE